MIILVKKNMVRVLKAFYIDYEILEKLYSLKEKYGNINNAMKYLLKAAEEYEKMTVLKENTIINEINGLKTEIAKIKDILLKFAKVWGVAV